MRTTELILFALRGLRQKPGRSLLTALGVIVGVAAVITMLSLGRGAESVILGQLQSFGPDSLFVEPGATEGPSQLAALTALKIKDVERLRDLPEVGHLAPVLFNEEVANALGEQMKVTVFSTTADILEIERIDMAVGRFLAPEEAEASVAVLGSKVADELFGGAAEAVGQEIRVGRRGFTVIGVAEPRGTQFIIDLDTYVYIPFSVGADRLFGVDYVAFAEMVPAAGVTADEAKAAVAASLRESHRIEDPADDDFHITTAEEAASILGTVSLALTLFLTAIAGISLVVGGIGIMNIMLVAVTERTREVGLRMAVGATRQDILRQFLAEAVALTGLGGLVGIALGVGASFVAALGIGQVQTGWVFVVPLEAVGVSFAVAVGTGLVFGIYPAIKASRLNPIDALRYE